LNSGCHVALDLDTEERFLRAFVSLGFADTSVAKNSQLFGFDGTHSKNDRYRGIILTLISRDGNGNNITAALAVVHSENKSNIMWFFRQCVLSGIRFNQVPVFCDRGKIIESADSLYAEDGLVLNLKFCTIHIIRNIKKEFKLNGRAFENAIWNIQGASTELLYCEALSDFSRLYGEGSADYVAKIDPTAWTV
jgi:hypothetical protein